MKICITVYDKGKRNMHLQNFEKLVTDCNHFEIIDKFFEYKQALEKMICMGVMKTLHRNFEYFLKCIKKTLTVFSG